MNVFVLCTGRCGSVTFARACRHIVNYTVGHESRCHSLGDDRLAFPDRHIEVDNRLAWFLGRIEKTFGDDAFYVHLVRDPEQVAQSWAERFGIAGGMAPAYRDAILVNAVHERGSISRLDSSRDYVRTVTENIEAFLARKSRVMEVRMETAAADFARFWDWIGAEGDLQRALGEWSRRHNERRRWTRPKVRAKNAVRRVMRAAFPPL